MPYPSNKGRKSFIAYTVDGSWESRASLASMSEGAEVGDWLRAFFVVREWSRLKISPQVGACIIRISPQQLRKEHVFLIRLFRGEVVVVGG